MSTAILVQYVRTEPSWTSVVATATCSTIITSSLRGSKTARLLRDRHKGFNSEMHFITYIACTSSNFCNMMWLNIISGLHDSISVFHIHNKFDLFF